MHAPSWALDLDRGLGSLARHQPAQAVRFLQKALSDCPPSHPRDLYRIGFYLGVALRRLGYSQSAIRSWLSCQRLHKRGHIRRLLSRLTNGYGMEKCSCEQQDDWAAFASVHILRYLMAKNRRSFATAAERDMVSDLIRDHWRALEGSGALEGRSSSRKLEIFRSVTIIFPTVVTDRPVVSSPVISVDFREQRRVRLDDRCPCGSGRTYLLCCGRIRGREELQTGIF
jgi:hypothetical protein